MSYQALSSFFARDIFQQRQGGSRKRSSRRAPQLVTNVPILDIIVEEDEPKSSVSAIPSPSIYSVAESRSASPIAESLSKIKTRRRDVGLSLSDARAAQEFLSDVESDFDEEESLLPWLSRPYIPATLSPGLSASTTSFKLTFEETTLEFPQPPPTTPSSLASFELDRHQSRSPAFSACSSPTSSPCASAESLDLPTTPLTSEDECDPPRPPPRNPLRVAVKAVKPLQITKRNTSKPDLTISVPEEDEEDVNAFGVTSPLLDDKEWYTREFSQFYSLGSASASSGSNPRSSRRMSIMMGHKPRPDSISFLPLPTMPPTPVSAGRPNTDLDPAFPRLRHSRSQSSLYGPRPLPPVPTTPTSAIFSLEEPSLQRKGSMRGPLPTPPAVRPPPRTSLPADCVPRGDESFGFEDDQSIFSGSFRDSVITRNTTRHARSSSFPESIKSFYSQASYLPPAYSPGNTYYTPSVNVQDTESRQMSLDDVDFQFGADAMMKLPLSLPSSPIDLTSDVLDAFDALRLRTVEI